MEFCDVIQTAWCNRFCRQRKFFAINMDTFGRTIDYLRISITDRCNERCLYCMPEGYKGWETKPDHLTADEIVRVVRVAAGMGFRTNARGYDLNRDFVKADAPRRVRSSRSRRRGAPTSSSTTT